MSLRPWPAFCCSAQLKQLAILPLLGARAFLPCLLGLDCAFGHLVWRLRTRPWGLSWESVQEHRVNTAQSRHAGGLRADVGTLLCTGLCVSCGPPSSHTAGFCGPQPVHPASQFQLRCQPCPLLPPLPSLPSGTQGHFFIGPEQPYFLS